MHAVAFLTIPGRTRRMGQKDRLNSAKLILLTIFIKSKPLYYSANIRIS
jgi:hypothetical protein